MLASAAKLGYTMNAGMEAEFFMFKPRRKRRRVDETHDVGSYFDLAPADLGEDAGGRSTSPRASMDSKSRRRITRLPTVSTR